MKKLLSTLALALALCFSVQLSAQKNTITVEASDEDISENLDLRAIAYIFGEARTLEDFERRINDYDAQVSNLDLNRDGDVDYMRVVELPDNNAHVILIQAVLAKDIYQDIATIIVEKQNNETVVQIVGDSYIYGANYVIEPVYVNVPVIYDFFWGPFYHRWYSPYVWHSYPPYYRYRHCCAWHHYYSHCYAHYHDPYHHHYHYHYPPKPHHEPSHYQQYNNYSRRDYSQRYPEQTFENRNSNYRAKNAQELSSTRDAQTGTRVAQTATPREQMNRTANTGTRTPTSANASDTRTATSSTSSRTPATTTTTTGSRTATTTTTGS
ncbi:MAG: hypothetical protein Q4D14_06330, partial [Bacteroidales bacterium]|nr:hypothetical protein [Bacteroidales bacterium]